MLSDDEFVGGLNCLTRVQIFWPTSNLGALVQVLTCCWNLRIGISSPQKNGEISKDDKLFGAAWANRPVAQKFSGSEFLFAIFTGFNDLWSSKMVAHTNHYTGVFKGNQVLANC